MMRRRTSFKVSSMVGADVRMVRAGAGGRGGLVSSVSASSSRAW
jgi:hypothetical protein